MYIVVLGRVGIYRDPDLVVCAYEVGENGDFGMRLLQSEDTQRVRTASAVAHCDTICISLDFQSYNEQVFFLEHQQRQSRLSLLRVMPLFQGWPVEKLKQLNLSMAQQKYQAGDVVYDLDETPDRIYILLRGELTLETEVEIEQVNQFPIVSRSPWVTLGRAWTGGNTR